jgi:hypothetical protein
MDTKRRTIDVDAATAEMLEARALERGLSVSELLAELVEVAGDLPSVRPEEIAELERRWAEYQRTGEAYDHDEVEAWLRTVGTPDYRPFDDFRASMKRS